MSQDNRSRTKNSSQVPRSRAPPQGSAGSASQRDKQSNSQGQGEAEIPSEAITSSTSRPQKTSSPQQEWRRESNVQLAPAPSLDPSDSISRVKTRSTWPGPNSNSQRKGSRSSRTPWKSYGSHVTRASSQNGTAWSGSGAALTENNLEKLNEATAKGQSDGYSNQEPRSDQQLAPQSAQRSSRRDRNAANGDFARTSGPQQMAQRSSQQYSTAQDNGAPYENTTKCVGAQTNGSLRSKQQSQAASKNVTDVNPPQPGTKQSMGGSQSKGGSKSQGRSRKDSMFQGEGADVAPTSSEVNTEIQSARTGPRSGTKALSKPSSASKPQSAGSPTSPTQPELPSGWERKVRTITKRWPNGREVTEREVTVQPVGTG